MTHPDRAEGLVHIHIYIYIYKYMHDKVSDVYKQTVLTLIEYIVDSFAFFCLMIV